MKLSSYPAPAFQFIYCQLFPMIPIKVNKEELFSRLGVLGIFLLQPDSVLPDQDEPSPPPQGPEKYQR